MHKVKHLKKQYKDAAEKLGQSSVGTESDDVSGIEIFVGFNWFFQLHAVMKYRTMMNPLGLLESCTLVSPTVTAQASQSIDTLPPQRPTAAIEPLTKESNIDNTAGVEADDGLADNEPSSDVDCVVDHHEAEKQISCTTATASAKTASTACSKALPNANPAKKKKE